MIFKYIVPIAADSFKVLNSSAFAAKSIHFALYRNKQFRLRILVFAVICALSLLKALESHSIASRINFVPHYWMNRVQGKKIHSLLFFFYKGTCVTTQFSKERNNKSEEENNNKFYYKPNLFQWCLFLFFSFNVLMKFVNCCFQLVFVTAEIAFKILRNFSEYKK